MSLNNPNRLDYTTKYKILNGRVNFADYSQRQQLVQEGRLLGISPVKPDQQKSYDILLNVEVGQVNTTETELEQYLAQIELPESQQSAPPSLPVPDPPTGLSATAGNAQVAITFTAGSDGGSAITNYEYSTDGGATFFAFSPADITSPVTITTLSSDGATSLTNGTTYSIQLKAVNANGSSVASSSVSATPSTVPSAPTGLSATAGNAELTISFTPGSDGGSTITNYQYSTNGGTTYLALSPADSTSPITITTLSTDGTTPLTNGTTYTIRLKAVNANGTSVASSTVSGTPSTVPSAPTGLSGSAGDKQVTITFTAGSTGGSAITNYQYSTDGGSTFIALSPADSTSPVTISTLSTDGTTALTNGTAYTISLKAVNANGVSSASSSVTVTPLAGISVIILGDSAVTTLSTALQSAKTALGLSPALTITTQQLNGYTGTNLTSFDVCILYTNGGLNLNATLGTNLNNYVAGGGHLIMGSFAWGNVSAITNFNYNSYSTYAFKGSYTSTDTSTAIYTTVHPITTGIATATGAASQNIPNPITSTTTPGTQVIATYGNGTTSFIAVGQNGTARLVGINLYFVGPYSGNFQNTIKYVCNAIYWCKGVI